MTAMTALKAAAAAAAASDLYRYGQAMILPLETGGAMETEGMPMAMATPLAAAP
jgi:hypothetical protein